MRLLYINSISGIKVCEVPNKLTDWIVYGVLENRPARGGMGDWGPVGDMRQVM
jgi:hypothetical protein